MRGSVNTPTVVTKSERPQVTHQLTLASFEQKTVPFAVGDVLILYSDGVVEACPANTEDEFGEERLVRIVGACGALDLQRIIERVMEELKAWSGDGSYADDVTIMLARRRVSA